VEAVKPEVFDQERTGLSDNADTQKGKKTMDTDVLVRGGLTILMVVWAFTRGKDLPLRGFQAGLGLLQEVWLPLNPDLAKAKRTSRPAKEETAIRSHRSVMLSAFRLATTFLAYRETGRFARDLKFTTSGGLSRTHLPTTEVKRPLPITQWRTPAMWQCYWK